MPSSYPEPANELQFQRVFQVTDSHCGPAVTQMLLSFHDVVVSQDAVAIAGEAADRLDEHGMRIDQLGMAVSRLAPDLQFWYKHDSSLEDIATIIDEYRHPVGIEWQGLFYESFEEEREQTEGEETDFGHLSIVTNVDFDNDVITIVDPYRDFGLRDRYFSLKDFEDRWWDYNEVYVHEAGQTTLVEDYRVMFVVTRKGEYFPKLLGMRAATT